MKQKITILTKSIKAVVIPNDILEKLDNPEVFDLKFDGKTITLDVIEKKENSSKPLIDNSMDLYNID